MARPRVSLRTATAVVEYPRELFTLAGVFGGCALALIPDHLREKCSPVVPT